jgi:hypothetical protein
MYIHVHKAWFKLDIPFSKQGLYNVHVFKETSLKIKVWLQFQAKLELGVVQPVRAPLCSNPSLPFLPSDDVFEAPQRGAFAGGKIRRRSLKGAEMFV